LHILQSARRRSGSTAISAGTSRRAQRSVRLPVIEEQITTYLETFQLPDDIVAEVVSLYEAGREQRHDADRERREIVSRL
jgi:hypothetical protein